MRIPPSDYDAAMRVMQLFKERNIHQGQVLKNEHFSTWFTNDQFDLSEDFKRGGDYAITKGWIVREEVTLWYKLTADGFSLICEM
jgi:hypothetical protein